MPKDPRSTGRKRGRAKLFQLGAVYACVDCGRTPKRTPPDAPANLNWPESDRVLDAALQVNHINKNILDNDPVNLEWLCASCHKLKDQQTSVGESLIDDEFGYEW